MFFNRLSPLLLTFLSPILLTLSCGNAQQISENTALSLPNQPTVKTENKWEKPLESLTPQNNDDCGLLLSFDTDSSQDSESYRQFYDFRAKDEEKNPTNKTLYITRKGNTIELANSLNYIASPQKNGFFYLGQVRYFEPKPRDPNEHLDKLEKEGSLKNFGFDYTRIWKTSTRKDITKAKEKILSQVKKNIDAEYNKLSNDDREYHRNISDYEKVSFISDSFYTISGFWSVIHGGAAWFEANTKSEIVSLSNSKVSNRLKDYFSKSTIENKYKEDGHDLEMTRWSGNESVGFYENSLIDLERNAARTHISGLIMMDGNAHRSFQEEADFGKAPSSLIKYDNPDLDFEAFKKAEPDTIDVFVSPNQNTVFVLTKENIIGLDVAKKEEILKIKHNLRFNKVIMVEWAMKDFVKKWETELAEED